MIHPRNLLRNDQSDFSAPIGQNTLDWGIKQLPCLNKVFPWNVFGKLWVVLSLLCLIGVLQGILLAYVRGTSEIWGRHYGIDQDFIDWVVFLNEVINGLLALTIAYWGNKINRISWITGLIFFHAVSCALLVVPEVYKENSAHGIVAPNASLHLCKPTSSGKLLDGNINHVAVFILIVYETFSSAAYVSFISLGITYIIDNSPLQRAGFIGLILSCKEIGQQFGLYLSWLPRLFQSQSVFVTPVWLTLICIYFLVGILMAMFPKELPAILIQKLAASLVNLASGVDSSSTSVIQIPFWSSLWAIIKNPTAIVTILAQTLVMSAVINFTILEKYYKQTQFLMATTNDRSGYNDSWIVQMTTNLLKQPFIALSMILTGFVVSKMELKTRSLIIWNSIAYLVVTLCFCSYLFLKCDNLEVYNHRLALKTYGPYCSANCGCSLEDPFQPVCLQGLTYYSPCFAGCTSANETVNNVFYSGCSCSNTQWASHGACNLAKCNLIYGISQVNGIFSAGQIASTFVISFIIIIRAVNPHARHLAIALGLTFLGLVPYLPVRIIYALVTDHFCQYRTKASKCAIFSKGFGTFLTTSTAGLLVLGTIVSFVTIWFKSVDDNDTTLNSREDLDERNELRPMVPQPQQYSRSQISVARSGTSDGSANRSAGSEGNASMNSLLELAQTIGDDHDSDLEPYQRPYVPRISRVMEESDL